MTAKEYEDAINHLHQAFWLVSDITSDWRPGCPVFQESHPNIAPAIEHIMRVKFKLIGEARNAGYKIDQTSNPTRNLLSERYIVSE